MVHMQAGGEGGARGGQQGEAHRDVHLQSLTAACAQRTLAHLGVVGDLVLFHRPARGEAAAPLAALTWHHPVCCPIRLDLGSLVDESGGRLLLTRHLGELEGHLALVLVDLFLVGSYGLRLHVQLTPGLRRPEVPTG